MRNRSQGTAGEGAHGKAFAAVL